jgi:hypothetical protein
MNGRNLFADGGGPRKSCAVKPAAEAWLPLLALALFTACGSFEDSIGPLPSRPASGASGTGGQPSSPVGTSGAGGVVDPLGRTRCHAPAGISGSPRSIEEAVALINGLPKPTSVACFVESLDRPLYAFATSSRVSAQPAFSAKSPRLFLRLGQLTLSVVVEGESSLLLEFGYLTEGDARSVKGELEFPQPAQLSAAAPYERIARDGGTVCNVCHSSEQPTETVPFTQAYASLAFRPNPAYQVGLDQLKAEQLACDFAVEPSRCEMLAALFGGGQVLPAEFPQTMTIFF